MGEVGRQATRAAGAADDATDSHGFVLAARAGYVAAGLLHIMIGVIALRVARGGSGLADQSGAVAALAANPGGTVLLWACFLGCVALAVFLLSEMFFGGKGRTDRERLEHKLKSGGRPWCTARSGPSSGPTRWAAPPTAAHRRSPSARG